VTEGVPVVFFGEPAHKLAKAMGVEHLRVCSIELHANVGDLVRARVEYQINGEAFLEVMELIARYQWEPIVKEDTTSEQDEDHRGGGAGPRRQPD
jgi:hypothetical protein